MKTTSSLKKETERLRQAVAQTAKEFVRNQPNLRCLLLPDTDKHPHVAILIGVNQQGWRLNAKEKSGLRNQTIRAFCFGLRDHTMLIPTSTLNQLTIEAVVVPQQELDRQAEAWKGGKLVRPEASSEVLALLSAVLEHKVLYGKVEAPLRGSAATTLDLKFKEILEAAAFQGSRLIRDQDKNTLQLRLTALHEVLALQACLYVEHYACQFAAGLLDVVDDLATDTDTKQAVLKGLSAALKNAGKEALKPGPDISKLLQFYTLTGSSDTFPASEVLEKHRVEKLAQRRLPKSLRAHLVGLHSQGKKEKKK